MEVNIYSSPINEFTAVYISCLFFFLMKRLRMKKLAVQSHLAHAM